MLIQGHHDQGHDCTILSALLGQTLGSPPPTQFCLLPPDTDIVLIITAFLQHSTVSKHFQIHSVKYVSEYDPHHRAVYWLIFCVKLVESGCVDTWSKVILGGA